MPPDEHDLSHKGNNPHWLVRLLCRFQALVSRDFIAAQVDREARDVVIGKNIIKIGTLIIPTPVTLIILAGVVIGVICIGIIVRNTSTISQALIAPTPIPTAIPLPTATPLQFATGASTETLILLATFHNTAATNAEAHTKIQRAIEAEAAKNAEQHLRAEVEPTELTADQRTEAEALGKRYNASMVIWGEDTGVEIIVNFLNLKEPDFDAAAATIIERERTQLANPSAYAHFITSDLPQQMTFFALFSIGQSYYLNGDYSVAIARIEAAIALFPPTAAPIGLADAYFRLGWLYHVPTPNNLSRAIANYDKAIELNPTANAYNNRGNAHSAQGTLSKAIADYDKAIELSAAAAFTYNNRGLAHFIQGSLDEAIANYDKAIMLNPDYANAYYNRGLAHFTQGKLDKAIADYDKAIELNSNHADAYIARGNAYSDQEKLDEAIADYEKASTISVYANHTCIATSDGRVQCWGWNNHRGSVPQILDGQR